MKKFTLEEIKTEIEIWRTYGLDDIQLQGMWMLYRTLNKSEPLVKEL